MDLLTLLKTVLIATRGQPKILFALIAVAFLTFTLYSAIYFSKDGILIFGLYILLAAIALLVLAVLITKNNMDDFKKTRGKKLIKSQKTPLHKHA